MPLPTGGSNVAWPPLEWRAITAKWREWDAWYSADPVRLQDVYGSTEFTTGPSVRGGFWRRFWNRTGAPQRTIVSNRAQLHVPLAGDIAATSAALLFGEAPRLYIPEAHVEQAPPAAIETEDYVQRIVGEGDVLNRLMEAGETAAAMGGVFLRPAWDKELADIPLLDIVQADRGYPTFSYGRLLGATLWRELGRTGNQNVWRHLEVHEVDAAGRGVVYHGLFRGAAGALGDSIDLKAHSATANLEQVVSLPFDGLGVEYIPNMRPNRADRGSPLGQSDYAGIESTFDALDEVYASWLRDIRLAKMRIMVPEEYLDNLGAFDIDQEVYVPLNVDPAAKAEAGTGIMAQQFTIRVAEHETTAMNLIERAVTAAGYAPQTFGLHIEGRAESGTALKIREGKTFLTQRRKASWWAPGIESALHKMVQIGVAEFSASADASFRPAAELADSLPENPMELAGVIGALDQARAASTETKVRMAHADWTDEQVAAEVELIGAEQGLHVAAPEDIAAGGPVLTSEMTTQIGELFRSGYTPESIVAAIAADDMGLLVPTGELSASTRAADGGPAPAGGAFGA